MKFVGCYLLRHVNVSHPFRYLLIWHSVTMSRDQIFQALSQLFILQVAQSRMRVWDRGCTTCTCLFEGWECCFDAMYILSSPSGNEPADLVDCRVGLVVLQVPCQTFWAGFDNMAGVWVYEPALDLVSMQHSNFSTSLFKIYLYKNNLKGKWHRHVHEQWAYDRYPVQ